jgi:hypothetical protein
MLRSSASALTVHQVTTSARLLVPKPSRQGASNGAPVRPTYVPLGLLRLVTRGADDRLLNVGFGSLGTVGRNRSMGVIADTVSVGIN